MAAGLCTRALVHRSRGRRAPAARSGARDLAGDLKGSNHADRVLWCTMAGLRRATHLGTQCGRFEKHWTLWQRATRLDQAQQISCTSPKSRLVALARAQVLCSCVARRPPSRSAQIYLWNSMESTEFGIPRVGALTAICQPGPLHPQAGPAASQHACMHSMQYWACTARGSARERSLVHALSLLQARALLCCRLPPSVPGRQYVCRRTGLLLAPRGANLRLATLPGRRNALAHGSP